MSTVDYDPYSHEAMKDPYPLYAAMRKEGKPHFMPKYNGWALARFQDIWDASSKVDDNCTFTKGQTPGQVLLGEPVPVTFMTMDAPEHRKWRGLIRHEFTPEGVREQEARLRALTKELLAPLLKKGQFDIYSELANRVTCINAGHNLGLPREDAEKWRALIDDMLHREEGQVGGGSARNQAAAGELFGYFAQYVHQLRNDPALAQRYTKIFLDANVDGRTLTDEEMMHHLFSLLIVGSETTPITVGSTFWNLQHNPDQKAAVLAEAKEGKFDLARKAFLETVRFDQPTNMLARSAKRDFELNGVQIKAGQPVLFLYASAERDETVHPNPDKFDLYRQPTEKSLMFGHGGHKCLGLHLGVMMGCIIVEEILKACPDFEVVDDQCERVYGEHLSGWGKVVIKFKPH
ncbi:MAG: cytochrome P450 [Pseudomonadales bacterium]|jgi:cytochrome P450